MQIKNITNKNIGDNTMATKKTMTESDKLIKELIAELLKRAGLKEKDVTEIALKRWAINNLDLMTKKELEKYKSILAYDK